jgi:hypothetical protein
VRCVIGRRRLVIVHQLDGPTIEGVSGAFSWWREFFWHEKKLKRARLVEAEGQTVPLEGDVTIPRERVVFSQLVARSG